MNGKIIIGIVCDGTSLNIVQQKGLFKQGRFWILHLIMNGTVVAVTDVTGAVLF
jgi:hypothetical protein